MAEVYKLLSLLEKNIDGMKDIEADEALDHIEDWLEELRESRTELEDEK